MADINSLIVYGHTGVGKTTLVANIMSNALWVVTRKSNLGGYHTYIRQNPEEAAAQGLTPITKIIQVPRMLPNEKTGQLEKTDVRQFIKELVGEYVKAVQSGAAQGMHGIVFDELSVLSKWVYDYIKANERNGYEVIAQIKEWVGELCEISAATDLPMAFICHTKDPAYHEDGPKKGSIKYRGGPAMPVGTMVAEVCALPDAVLQVDLEREGVDGVKRVIRTEPTPSWERKCRVWGTPATMEPDLRPLLTKAGWNFNQAA